MDCPAHPATHQKLAYQIHRRSLTLARVSHSTPPSQISHSDSIHTSRRTNDNFSQLSLGHGGAPPRHLRDRARPERASDRTTAALRPLLAALMGPMHVLRRGALAPVVRRRAWKHAGGLGRARSGAGICSPSACIYPYAVLKGRTAPFPSFHPSFYPTEVSRPVPMRAY